MIIHDCLPVIRELISFVSPTALKTKPNLSASVFGLVALGLSAVLLDIGPEERCIVEVPPTPTTTDPWGVLIRGITEQVSDMIKSFRISVSFTPDRSDYL